MKKFLLSAAAAILAFGASAQTAKEDVRIYINPGHGSWGPNNRHMATIGHNPISSEDPDTTDFFESNTNLQKGLQVLHMLAEYGVPFDHTKNQTNENPNRIGAALDLSQNLVMSHVKCGPYPYEYKYDYIERADTDSVGNITTYIDTVMTQNPDQYNDFNRTLSVIADEVEANNFDMFVSIHSNAATDGNTVNYLAYFYRTNKGADGTICVAMSEKSWNQRILDRHTKWSHYDNQVGNGTVKIETYNYGVLSHTVPGFLVEGYFHTYQPSRHRYMNFDVCQLEGRDYARGIADYFGWEKESYGAIYGIVRDKYNKFADAVYSPKAGTTDVYKPLNDVEVTLKDSEGNVVDTYTTDVNYNGAFVFKKVQPGNYTVEFAHPAYFSDVYTDNNINSEPTTLNVTVTAAATSFPEAFLVDTAWVAPTTVYVNYPDSTAGKDEYNLFPSYETKATAYDLLAEQLTGKTIRRQLVRDDKVYVLAVDESSEPSVYVADLANSTVATLGTTAAVGDIYKVSDIALTADGYLVGINKCNQAYGGSSNVTAYKWENDSTGTPTGELAIWWTNNFAGNWSNGIAGESVIYDGTLAEGNMIYTGTTTASSGATRLVKAAISEGSYLGYMRNNQDGTYLTTTYFGDTFNMTLSPHADDQIIFNSATIQPFEIQLNTADAGVPTIVSHLSDGSLDKASAAATFFKYAGKDLMVAPNVADGKVAGLKMFDITDGLDNAKEIEVQGGEIDPVDYTYASAHGELALTLDAVGNTTGAKIELFLVVDGQATKFTETETYTTYAPANGGTANPFAYALTSEVEETTLKINYSLNADAEDVKVVIKDENDVEIEVIEQGAQSKGAQSAEVSISNYEAGKYTWEVVVDGADKTEVETFGSYRFYHPRGVDVDNNMESPSFGNIYCTEGMTSSSETYHSNTTTSGGLGLYAFTADMEPIINNATGKYGFTGGWTLSYKIGSSNAADLARVRVADDGRIFVTRMSGQGNYIMYAPSFEDLAANNTFTSLFDGLTLDASTYKYSDASGNFMGAANLGFDVIGSGDDLKLLALSSNANHWSYVYSGGSTDEYALGTAATLPVPTNVAALTGKYTIAPATTNVTYDDVNGGIWYCQYRGTPTASQPGLVYIDAEGNEKYKDLVSRGGGGVRVSPDGKQIAVASSSANPKQFTVYNLVWSEDGTPALRREYVITHNIGTNVYDIAWDLAGNIYICGNSGEYLKGFALPRTEAFTTKAASKYSFSVTADGIDAISVDNDEDAPVEYYNLQGVKVENPSNGIFIKVQGKKSEKVYIK